MARYAAKTDVPVIKSRAEIEACVARYGADQFLSFTGPDKAVIGFTLNNRQVRFDLPLPDKSSDEFWVYRRGRNEHRRSEEAALQQWEQACRQRWRALFLVIKAKLEAVECGITQFEEEFLAHIVLPNGETVGHVMLPQIETAYETGNMPPLLPAPEHYGGKSA